MAKDNQSQVNFISTIIESNCQSWFIIHLSEFQEAKPLVFHCVQ